MKKILFSLAILFLTIRSYAVLDTLRHYNPAGASKGKSYPATFIKSYARFEPIAPGNITQVIVTLNGSAGTCVMHIFGQSGGGPVVQQQIDLISPITVTKPATGINKVVVTLPTPVYVDNNQFFLKFESFSSGVSLVTDTVAQLNCSSIWGGNMWYQSLQNASGTLGTAGSAFAVDVIMDYNAVASPQMLQDISISSGLGTANSNTTISWGDIDNDGFLDLLAAGKLFKNNQDNTFTDITAAAGINTPFFINNFIDMNNDGKEDLLFLSMTPADNVVYINNGNSTFTKTPLNFTTPAFDFISTISIADVNNDKYPDMFVGQLRNATTSAALPNYFFINNKNNGFIDSTKTFYPTKVLSETRGSQFVDFDNDGDLDLYVSLYRNKQDEFWQNNGNGTFTNICAEKDIDYANNKSSHGTGVDWADYDNDGDMDLLLPQLCHGTNLTAGYSTTTIYTNSGAPSYTFTKAGSTGIQYEETHAGAHWGDINSDGLMDLFFSAFYSCRFSDIYVQQPNNSFQLKSWDYGIQNVSGETDGTFVDFNNDGKLDLACGDNTYFLRLFKNNSVTTNNYIAVNLVSTSGNAMAIGAKVVLEAGGKTYLQYQIPNHGALMNKSNRLFFGLGSADSIDKITVSWPNGTVNAEEFTTGLNINSVITLTEGSGSNVSAIEQVGTILQHVSVYPNPGVNAVTFEYMLTDQSYLGIEVYSAVGAKVASVMSENQAAGSHKITFDGSGWPAGIYNYRVITGSGQQNGRVTLVH